MAQEIEAKFEKSLREFISSELTKASEALIKEALAKYEQELRKQVASYAQIYLDKHYSMHIDQSTLVIRVER